MGASIRPYLQSHTRDKDLDRIVGRRGCQGTAGLKKQFLLGPTRNLPDFLVPTQKKAKELHKHEKALYLGHWLNAKPAIESGTIPACFCVGMAKAQESERFSDDQAAYISGTLLVAGADTTSNTFYTFVQAMLLYPDIQSKAQGEVDRVIGPDHLPTMDDEPNRPYIHACIKETLRWMPTTILGAVPHPVTKNDYYMGYLIPQGARILNNVWAINMDPQRHPHPRKFNPDRYKDDKLSLSDSAAHSDGTKRDQFTFGAGRRICPGMHVAERSLFLGMARILSAFNIEPALDMAGELIIPNQERLTQGFVYARGLPGEDHAQITGEGGIGGERVG